MWRPKGFPEYYDVLLPKYFRGLELKSEQRRLGEAFEAGADAILEALKKEETARRIITVKDCRISFEFPSGVNGWIVFIPDES